MGKLVVRNAAMVIEHVGGNAYEGVVVLEGVHVVLGFELRGNSVHVDGERVGDVLQDSAGRWVAVPAVVHRCNSAIEAAALFVANTQ